MSTIRATPPPADGPQIRHIGEESAHRSLLGQRDRLIAQLAERQHGVVSLEQLDALGLDARAVGKRVSSGRLHRVYQGVYAVGYCLLSPNAQRMAAVLACGPEAVLSHRSAAALWGMRDESRIRLDITAPGRRGRIPDGIDAHRHGSLRPADVTKVEGIPCTTLARTLLDLAGVVPYRELRHAVTQSEVRRLFDLGAVQEVIARGRGRRGVARLRTAIAQHDPLDERARNRLERRFVSLCREAGLPPPEVNSALVVEGRNLEPDFLWQDERLIVETDGFETHGTRTAFEDDRRRDQLLKANGWEVVRSTWRQIQDDPASLIRAIHAIRRLCSGRWA